MRFFTACKAFWQILVSSDKAVAWRRLQEAPMKVQGPEVAPPQRPSGILPDAVYTLVLLQREGRLVDFVREDIEAYSDEQVGAAVRQIHAGCRKVLDDHFDVQPIQAKAEGETVEIPAGFDSSAVRLTGNVSGDPPFKGVLQHRGWRVSKVEFPERHAKLDPSVICPAEVELK